MTTDTENGIILGVDCYAANRRESDIILEHIEKLQKNTGVSINKLALDAGYDVGAVHRGLELLGIAGYVSCISFSNDVLKRDLTYLKEADCFECKAGKQIKFTKSYTKRQPKTTIGFIVCPPPNERTANPANISRTVLCSQRTSKLCQFLLSSVLQ